MMTSHEPATLSAKITATHLERLACVYVRQSTPKQVERHRESQRYQYHLVQRAAALGWSEERTRVIDSDLGLSGKESAHRGGFTDLVAEVSLGHVGIVLGYEVSRLARNNRDWYHLLDLAAVFGTLIADSDGVYDTRLYNDRLLLGLKGTMSEAELHLLRLRLTAGRMNQVRRGAYRQHLPTGLTRLPDATVVKEPDAQVRHTIELIFEKFDELGTCEKVLRYLREKELRLPRWQRAGLHSGELLWKRASYAAILEVIHNPAYAGAFAYGRRQTDPRRQQPGRQGTGHLHTPREEWLHLQRDVYPAYITWEQYEAHQARLQQNATDFGARTAPRSENGARGAVREGAALLQGLVVCGCCGYRMYVIYKVTGRYNCRALRRPIGQGMCASLHAPSVDEAVTRAFFDALRPARLDALEAVLGEQLAERERLARHWQERMKRARYDAHLAQRQYDTVDPENRLVAAELERRWEASLRELRVTEEAFERFEREPEATLTPELRQQLRHISEALPGLWASGQLSAAQKKELLRSLIAQVILKRVTPDHLEVKLVWISGHYTVVSARPPIQRECDVTGYAEMVARVESMWREGLEDDVEMAGQLTREGFHSARAAKVLPVTVRKIRKAQGWRYSLDVGRTELAWQGALTARGLASRLGIDVNWVYRRLYGGAIKAEYLSRHPQSNIWLIQDRPEVIEPLRQMLPEKTGH
ncbi:MAG: recombinase family protein [Acidobacteria bacterium]|nr:recombinase family protein [Acidobacteriota bacterium]